MGATQQAALNIEGPATGDRECSSIYFFLAMVMDLK
jgi:hypothetical protein